MSINKLALIRYKTIDNCLKNRYRKWTLEDLVTACSETLYDYEGIPDGVSKRTVQLDIQNMRSEKLGYNAPIIVVDKKFYTYEDKDYSITNIPLSIQDLGTLNEVVGVLKQFTGFSYFQELTLMVNKLEDKIFKQQNNGKSFINFEKNELLKGLEFIDPLHKAILDKKVLGINYQSFKARQASEIIFHPYLLKEFRNRWFVLGSGIKNQIMNLALDRIAAMREVSDLAYLENDQVDLDTYYDDVIGVTKMPNQRPQTIIMKIDRKNAPYIITKPLHPSQKIEKDGADATIFSIKVIWNFELEREILGFGEQIQVLGPRRLRDIIKRRLNDAANSYDLVLPGKIGDS